MTVNSNKYTESGIEVDLSGFSHFRFEECRGYEEIKGLNIKEIDFGWWNAGENCLYLLELKDYSFVTNHLPKEKSGELIENLLKKSQDVIFMLSATWLKNGGSENIKKCLPREAQEKCKIKIFHLINCRMTFETHLLGLNTVLSSKFRGYQKLFENILTFRIISARQAEKIFIDPNTRKPFVTKSS